MRQDDNPETKASNPKDIVAGREQRVPLHLIPTPGLVVTALAFADGARKYGPYNWRKEGVGAGTYTGAAERHIRAWYDGEEHAGDSNVHHLGHAIACLLILLDAQIGVGNLVDDRPPPAPSGRMMDALKRPTKPMPVTSSYEDQPPNLTADEMRRRWAETHPALPDPD